MKTRELLTDIQRTFFYEIPSEMSERELIRCYTLSDEELHIVNQQRGDHNRLGFAIQISYLRFPGRPLSAKENIPQFLVRFLAKQIGVASWEVQNYARTRDTTRREHVNKIRNLYNLRTFTLREYRELARWLLPLAMKTENRYLLVEALIQEMRKRKIILPAVYAIEHLAWSVRERARKRIFKYLTKGLSSYQYEQLDTLLYTREESKNSLLSWLRQPPGVISLKNFHEILDRLEFIQSLDLPLDNGKEIHQNRLIQMAREGSRYSIQHLSRFNERKRYATIMAFLIHIYAFLTDQGLDMFAKLMGRMFNRGENKHNKLFQKDGKSINEKVRLYVEIGKALIEAKELETDPFEAVQSIISWEKFIHSVHEAENLARPIEFDYLDLLDNHYGHFRKMAPRLLNRYVFKASLTSQTVLQALELLKEANQSGKRKIPDNVPTDFIKSKWMKYVYQDDKINRHYYEFSVFSELLNTLRSGDMWVKGSKQYKDFEEYLLPPHTWQHMKQTQQIPLEFTEDVENYLNKRFEQLDIELSKVNCLIANQDLQGVTIYGGKIQVASLKKMVPEEQIEEHYTDAAGFVDHIFGMCHVLGFRFSPRIKTIDNHKIYTVSVPIIYNHINFMVGGTIQVKKIRENLDEILRLVSSVRQGTVTASLILKKLSSYPRQNSLSIALREIGRIERSLYMLKWIQDPEHRRKVQVELNKGESKNSLARAVFFNQLGEIRDRSYEDQLHRASGLQLIISAIVTWNSIYISRAIETLRNNGIHIPEEYIQHISPLGWEHIALTGDYIWNLNQECNFENLRPLRKNKIKQK
ncbi:Tn3 family transposase [Bacillus thuringiensis]|nr:Tn3 family transposase [Bacillus thuringiensis]